MTVVRGFAITIGSGVVFAVLGGGMGYAVGLLAPDYYRTAFRISPESTTDPALFGLGLGITQGLAAGLTVGLVIVVSVAWYRSRTEAT